MIVIIFIFLIIYMSYFCVRTIEEIICPKLLFHDWKHSEDFNSEYNDRVLICSKCKKKNNERKERKSLYKQGR